MSKERETTNERGLTNERGGAFDGPYESPFDLYKDPDRAGNLKVRSKIMNLLAGYIDQKGFTQTEAGEHFGVSQGRISELLNGRISKFTVDYLINMCSRAGIEVDVTFEGAREEPTI